MTEEATTPPTSEPVAGPVQRPVGRPVEDESVQACAHPNKVERHFTYGYRWHCPDCKAGGEDWWD